MSQSISNDYLQNLSETMRGLCQGMSTDIAENKNGEVYSSLCLANQLISKVYNNQDNRSFQPE